jgi:hypothetical protein
VENYTFAEFPQSGNRMTLPIGHRTIGVRATSKMVATQAADFIVNLSKALNLIPDLASSNLCDTEALTRALRRFRSKKHKRTRTIPLEVGLSVIDKCCDWMLYVAEPLIRWVGAIERRYRHQDQRLKCEDLETRLNEAIQHTPVPDKLKSFRITEFFDHVVRPESRVGLMRSTGSTLAHKHWAVTEIIQLHTAICYVLIGILVCRRELLSTQFGNLVFVRKLPYLKVALGKTGLREVRRTLRKPVPQLVAMCFDSLKRLSQVLCLIQKPDDARVALHAFFQFNRNGVGFLTENCVTSMLDLLSEHFGARTKDGLLWHLRAHQLRRFFAFTFFHFGGLENSLPALSWFMGHDDLSKTWRYVKEELTGREISAIEAAMTVNAIYSDDQSESVNALRDVLHRHFKTEDLTVIDPDSVSDYLEVLSEKGIYSADPIQIRSASGVRTTVLIHIMEKADASTKKR